MEDLKKRAVRGGLAKLIGNLASFGLRAVSIVVLSRILNPKDFGLVAMATAVTGFYDLFTHAGLSTVTIQKADITHEQISTLFWVNMVVGAILGVLCIATGPILIRFYDEPRLFWVTTVLSAGFLINAAGVQHFALLERQLRYFAITVIGLAAQIISVCVGIAMAIEGWAYWALVVSTVVQLAVSTVCAWLVTSLIPGMPHRKIGIRSMLQFGGTITLNGVIVYIAYNLDKILIGRFWGADALGIYGRAYQLVNLPTSTINSSFGAVTFAALSRVQSDPIRLKNYFLDSYLIMVSMSIPITIFSALWADDLVLALLGPKWTDAVLIFRLLTPTILVFGMINPIFWLLISTGLQKRSLKIAFAISAILIISYVIGLPYGAEGVAGAFSIAMVLWVIPHIAWSLAGTSVSMWDLLSKLGRPLIAGMAAGGLTFGIHFFARNYQSHLLSLLTASVVMFVLYTAILLFVMGQKRFYLELLKNFRPA